MLVVAWLTLHLIDYEEHWAADQPVVSQISRVDKWFLLCANSQPNVQVSQPCELVGIKANLHSIFCRLSKEAGKADFPLGSAFQPVQVRPCSFGCLHPVYVLA